MKDKIIQQAIDVAVVNIKRLNALRIKRKLTEDGWRDFFTFKNILIANDTGIYTKEVKDIIYNN